MNFRYLSILFLVLSVFSWDSAYADPLKRYKALPPEPAPMDVVLKDLEGGDVKLSDYKGKIIILNFWATWCMPCISEMPSLNELAKLYKHDDFVVIAVAKDEKGPITPKEFRKRAKFYQMIFAMDSEKESLFNKLKVEGLPTTLVIDAEGMIVGKLVGGTDWTHEDVLHLMQKYIEGDAPHPSPVSLSDRFGEWFESIRNWVNGFFKKDSEKEVVSAQGPDAYLETQSLKEGGDPQSSNEKVPSEDSPNETQSSEESTEEESIKKDKSDSSDSSKEEEKLESSETKQDEKKEEKTEE